MYRIFLLRSCMFQSCLHEYACNVMLIDCMPSSDLYMGDVQCRVQTWLTAESRAELRCYGRISYGWFNNLQHVGWPITVIDAGRRDVIGQPCTPTVRIASTANSCYTLLTLHSCLGYYVITVKNEHCRVAVWQHSSVRGVVHVVSARHWLDAMWRQLDVMWRDVTTSSSHQATSASSRDQYSYDWCCSWHAARSSRWWWWWDSERRSTKPTQTQDQQSWASENARLERRARLATWRHALRHRNRK